MSEKQEPRAGWKDDVVAFATRNPDSSRDDLYAYYGNRWQLGESLTRSAVQQVDAEHRERQRDLIQALRCLGTTVVLPTLVAIMGTMFLTGGAIQVDWEISRTLAYLAVGILVTVALSMLALRTVWLHRRTRRARRRADQARRDAYLDGVWALIADGKDAPPPPDWL